MFLFETNFSKNISNFAEVKTWNSLIKIQALDYRLAGEALIERLLSLHSFTLSK